ncbi:hypothetical protein [Streptomyces sp. NPDC005408]|uniref:hypothetical protein n=1 Tax=Streptomyces sp. NPDC005408 TaxID=3155341 RepID=UPI0033A324A5
MTLQALAAACLLLLTFSYGVRCWLSPFGPCRKCSGMGHAIKHDRKGRMKRGKDCRRCNGHGIRIRIGRWIYNRAARIHRDGTR